MTALINLVSGTMNRIDELPSNITGSPIVYEFLDDSRIFVQNITGETISSDNVPEKYHAILKNLGALYILSRMTGIGVDFDYSLGSFKVKKGGSSNANRTQMEFLANQVNQSLLYLGRKIIFKATNI